MEYFKEKFVDFARIKDRQAAIQRIENIQRIGWALTPPVEAVVCNSGLLTRQKVIKFSNTFVKDVSLNHIIALSRQVTRFHRAGIVHGDLCLSNIGMRENKVFIFDWEPALVLDKKELRTSPYCIHPYDLTNRNLTSLTDRFAVLFLIVISHYPHDDLLRLHEGYKHRIVDFLETFKTHQIDNCSENFISFLGK